MAEIFEIDDIPQTVAPTSASEKVKGEKSIVSDKHLPSFDFGSYPQIEEDDLSPRIVEEVWQKFDKQS